MSTNTGPFNKYMNMYTRILLLLIVVITLISEKALTQDVPIITIDEAMPSIGDTVITISTQDTIDVSFLDLDGGTKKKWNLDALKYKADKFEAVIVDPKDVAGSDHFSGSSWAEKTSDIIHFKSSRNDSVFLLGTFIPIHGQIFHYDPPLLTGVYPMTYGMSWSYDTGIRSSNFLGSLKTEMHIQAKTEAWGDVIFENKTYHCLLIKTEFLSGELENTSPNRIVYGWISDNGSFLVSMSSLIGIKEDKEFIRSAGMTVRIRNPHRISHHDYERIWDFTKQTGWGNDFLNVYSDWTDDSKEGSQHSYCCEIFKGQGCLHVMTTASQGNTWDRVKVRTKEKFKCGLYEWNVYVPEIDEPGASSSIGAFMLSPPYRKDVRVKEIDFEIGYGKRDERTKYKIPKGKLMCYMSVQPDPMSKTGYNEDGTIDENRTDAIAIEPGSWYTLRIKLSTNKRSNYVVSWDLKKEGDLDWRGRSDYHLRFGPNDEDDDNSFFIECSVENFGPGENMWIGDEIPRNDKDAYFDYVSFLSP